MATGPTTTELAGYQRRHQELARQLAEVGFPVAQGSIASRFGRCGKNNCACHADPPQLHGPYWHWTTKIDGKTVNRRLSDTEADLYREWIANDRKLRQLIAEIREVGAHAARLIAEQNHQ